MNGDAVAPVLPGETLAGKYRVERILGRGGMGIVVAARHLELDERVAIKFLLRKDDPAAVERFIREARAAAKVKSEHVCRVYDVSRLETGEPYLVMEYLDGVDLADRLRVEGRVAIANVARWMIEICAALAEAHALGIVHRDIKPANVFLAKRSDETSTVKVLDFGISKLPTAEGAMTSTAAVIGTPLYMSPEQIASARDVDARTDIWSLGVIMYELVSGKPPFAGDSLIQLSVKIREAELPPLESGDARFDEVVAKCLKKDPAARWSTVGELAAELAPIAGGASVDLAKRLTRTLSTATAALAETVPDPRDEHVTPAPAPEHATLEPLSSARMPEERPKRSFPSRAAIALALAVGGLVVAARLATREPATAQEGVSTVVADVAPPPPSTTVSAALPPDPTPSAIDSSAPSKPLDAAKPRATTPATPAMTVTTAPVVVDAAAPVVAPAASAEPEPATTIKKKRALDRGDPYAR